MNGVVLLARSGLSVCGERNGRCKLTDRAVLMIRLARANRFPRPSYLELAEEREVHPRTIRRICKGVLRLDAGGPVEEPRDKEIESEVDDLPPAFDTTRMIKCYTCGHRAFPAWANPEICYACHVKQHGVKPIDDEVGPDSESDGDADCDSDYDSDYDSAEDDWPMSAGWSDRASSGILHSSLVS